MKIIILSDSLGRARPDLDELNRTESHDVYVTRIIKYFGSNAEANVLYIETSDSQDALLWTLEKAHTHEVDVVITHIGINDAVPRIFNKNSGSMLLHPWFRRITRDLFIRILHRNRFLVTKLIPKTYTTQLKFRNNLNEMLAEFKKYNPQVSHFGISICLAGDGLAKRSYNINKNIDQFNRVLEEVFKENYIEMNGLVPVGRLLINDDIHLTKEAHTQLANILISRLETINY